MHFQRFRVIPCLQPYVKTIWHFDSQTGIPLHDLRLIVPDGSVMLNIPYQNRLFRLTDGTFTEYPPMTCWILGRMQFPAMMDSDPEFCAIVVEFHPITAYRFFPMPMSELTNNSIPAEHIFGADVCKLVDWIRYSDSLDQRIACVQTFLYDHLQSSQRVNGGVEYAVQCIYHYGGMIRVGSLCQTVGYSRRHLARIVRFFHFYQALNTCREVTWAILHERFDAYSDQSHFIREFKVHTGLSPHEYLTTHSKISLAEWLEMITFFDFHMHIFDSRFSLVENGGYLPKPFTVEDYHRRTADFRVIGGAIVSASFQELNVKRGGAEQLANLEYLAKRCL